MSEWLKKNRLYLIFVAGVMLIAASFAVDAQALDIKGARPMTYFTGTAALDTVSVEVEGDAYWQLPDAYLLFTGDGSEFWVERYFGGTIDPKPIHIPASRSLVLPAQSPENISGYGWSHVFRTTSTDTIFVIPLDQ